MKGLDQLLLREGETIAAAGCIESSNPDWLRSLAPLGHAGYVKITPVTRYVARVTMTEAGLDALEKLNKPRKRR
jgi:hypothetical protein